MVILVIFVSIISLLIIHELGHFLIAKKFKVKVEEFGLGYPPRLLAKKFGQTLYSINLIPFGAFVKIPEEEKEFKNKFIWQRSLIIFGGVASFWLTAVILLSIVAGLGTTQIVTDDEEGALKNIRVQVLAVAADSPIEEVGVRTGDTIKGFAKIKELQDFVDENRGEKIALTIKRGGDDFTVSLVPRISPPAGQGAMGVSLVRVAERSYPWWQAPARGVEGTINISQAVVVGWSRIINSLIQGQGVPQGVQFVGPIGIGSLLNQAAQSGVNYFLQFIALLAVYLAIFNLLPIPALDGGKLLFLAIEKVKGRPVNQKIEQKFTTAFFALLILIMVWVTINDVIKLF